MDNVGEFLRNLERNCAVVQYSGFGETPGFESHIFFVTLGKLLNLSEPQHSHFSSFTFRIKIQNAKNSAWCLTHSKHLLKGRRMLSYFRGILSDQKYAL